MTDMDDADHISPSGLAGIVWSVFCVASVFVTARLSVRVYSHRALQTDDGWIILAWVVMLVMSAISTVQRDSIWFTYGAKEGRIHPSASELDLEREQLARWQFALVTLFWIALWSVKASFLAVFRQVTLPFKVQHRIWLGVTAFLSLAFLGCILCNVFSCSHPSDYFTAGKCRSASDIDHRKFSILVATILDIVSNLAIIGLQLSILPVLTLDTRKKIGLGVVFALNMFVVSVAVLRMAQIVMDPSIDIVGMSVWSSVEVCIALIIGSLPPLYGFASRYLRKRREDKDSSGSDQDDLYLESVYPFGSVSQTVMKIESILTDDAHRNTLSGGIFVQRTFSTHVENKSDIINSSLSASLRDDASDAPITAPSKVQRGRRWRWFGA